MKKTRRQKNSIIVSILLFSFLIFVLFLTFFLYLRWQLTEIETQKEEVEKLYNKYQNIEKSGLSYTDFKKLLNKKDFTVLIKWDTQEKKNSQNDYLKWIVDSVDSTFFDTYITNTKSWKFLDTITEKKSQLIESYDNSENDTIIKYVLPTYSKELSWVVWEDYSFSWEINEVIENWLSDFKFINYIESILANFGLQYKNSLGLENVMSLDNYSLSLKDSSLEKSIFYIPVELDIVWRKDSIIDFLYFIENVGKISIDSQDGIKVVEQVRRPWDPFLDFTNSLRNQKLKSRKQSNVFDNQIADIYSISFSENLDSWFVPDENIYSEKSEDFVKYLKNTQKNEKFEAKVIVHFYVKGLAKFRLEKFNTELEKNIKSVKGMINKILKTPSLSSVDKNEVQKMNTTFQSIEKSFLSMKTQMKKDESKLTEYYKSVFDYNKTINEYLQKVEQINKKIN